jgi:hypothetical protein
MLLSTRRWLCTDERRDIRGYWGFLESFLELWDDVMIKLNDKELVGAKSREEYGDGADEFSSGADIIMQHVTKIGEVV